MFTHKDIEYRTIFVINCIQQRELRVSNGELLLEELEEKKTLTKMPFQKILALFIIGHIHITTPLIEKCHKYNVALVVMKPNLRPVFYWSSSAEANILLRQQQYLYPKEDISIAKWLVVNKINNQMQLLIKTRKKDRLTLSAIAHCDDLISKVVAETEYEQLLGLEGRAAKAFFSAYFQDYNWTSRKPRTKQDELNTLLDIGYTILFNFIECFVRMFGFDIYVGVYHRLWFKRKSLICDLMEPFRCIIEHTIRIGYNRKQISNADFTQVKGEYRLKTEKNIDYYRLFYDALIPYKAEIFLYVQHYYRCFMQHKDTSNYPIFSMK